MLPLHVVKSGVHHVNGWGSRGEPDPRSLSMSDDDHDPDFHTSPQESVAGEKISLSRSSDPQIDPSLMEDVPSYGSNLPYQANNDTPPGYDWILQETSIAEVTAAVQQTAAATEPPSPGDQAQPTGVPEPPTNSGLIAELVAAYRKVVSPDQARKGDYPRIGKLYNTYGYDQVFKGITRLEQAIRKGTHLRDPISYLQRIIASLNEQHMPNMPNQLDAESQERLHEQYRFLYQIPESCLPDIQDLVTQQSSC